MPSSTSSSEPRGARYPGPAPRGWAAAALVLGPLAVLALAAALLLPPSQTLSRQAREMEEALAATPPDVVVVGNSLARAGLDPERLASELGGGVNVHRLDISNSAAPTWFAIVKNRVYANEHQPRIVLVVNTLEWLLANRPFGEFGRRRLADQLGEDDSLIRRRALGEEGGGERWLGRARQRAVELRESYLTWLREVGVGLTHRGDEAAGLRERGRAVADPALDRLFGEDAGDLGRRRRVVGVDDGGPERLPRAVAVEDGFLPDLARLVQAEGGKLIFVRVPLPPSNTSLDRLDPESEKAATAALEELGVGYLDLRSLPVPPGGYADLRHLNWLGRRLLTSAVAQALSEAAVLEGGTLPSVATPRVPRAVIRLGEPPARADLMAQCCRLRLPCAPSPRPPLALPCDGGVFTSSAAGAVTSGAVSPEPPAALLQPSAGFPEAGFAADPLDGTWLGTFSPALRSTPPYAVAETLPLRSSPRAREAEWWVYPGTTLRLEFADRETAAMDILAEGDAVGGEGGKASLAVAGEIVPFDRAGPRMRAALSGVSVGDVPWAVEIRSPADGPFIRLQSLAIGEPQAPSYVLGRPNRSRNTLRLVGRPRGSRVARLRWAAEPPAISAVERPRKADGRRVFAAKEVSLGLHPSLAAEEIPVDCSPLRLVADGRDWPGRASCRRRFLQEPGAYCGRGGEVVLNPLPGAEGDAAVRRFGLRLDPARRCGKGFWIYPSDRLMVEARRRISVVGADTLEISGVPFGKAVVGTLEIRVRVQDQVYLRRTLSLERFLEGGVTFLLDARLPAKGRRPQVELWTRDGASPFYLAVLALAETRPFATLGEPTPLR